MMYIHSFPKATLLWVSVSFYSIKKAQFFKASLYFMDGYPPWVVENVEKVAKLFFWMSWHKPYSFYICIPISDLST